MKAPSIKLMRKMNYSPSHPSNDIDDGNVIISLNPIMLEMGSTSELIEETPNLVDSNEEQNDKTLNNNKSETDNTQPKKKTPSVNGKTMTRFKWTKEKSQVAMNLVKHGCKPKLVAVAVGCSLRTAQKFVETVTPKIEGESFKNYEIRRRGRKSKDVNHRLNAIRDVLSKDSSKTQVEIAADLKVSNTTVCRDLKRIGTSWKKKRKKQIGNVNPDANEDPEVVKQEQEACIQGPSLCSQLNC